MIYPDYPEYLDILFAFTPIGAAQSLAEALTRLPLAVSLPIMGTALVATGIAAWYTRPGRTRQPKAIAVPTGIR